LGHVHTTAHRIELTPGASPVYCQLYRAGAKPREQESAEIHRMLQAGVIAPANAEWASPIVMVSKPDGSCSKMTPLIILSSLMTPIWLVTYI
jgi:hypothetical protein